jgi:hypothetical protein
MELWNYVAAMVPTAIASTGAAVWLTKRLLEHRLAKDLEAFKVELGEQTEKLRAHLQGRLNEDKALVEGQVKEQVETVLGTRAADREYELDARKRLYLAIGPLRLQLLLACRDLAGRIASHGRERTYATDVHGYYGMSTMFRVVRPLALAELAERQIAYADFAVDPGSLEMLRFKKNAFAAFSGGSLVQNHPQANWSRQEQHLFFDSIGRIANALIVSDGEGRERCMRFHEVEHVLQAEGPGRFEPLPALLHDFTPESKPLFWLRLVAFANLCNDYVNQSGGKLGFEQRIFTLQDVLARSKDAEILDKLGEYRERCQALLRSPL